MSQTNFELWMSKDEWKTYNTKPKRKQWYDARRDFVNAMPDGLKKTKYQAFIKRTKKVKNDDTTDYMTEWNDLKAMKAMFPGVTLKFNPFIV